MDHPQRGKPPSRRRRSNKPGQQQQQPHAGTRRSENAFITESQRTELVRLGEHSWPIVGPLPVSTRGIGLIISQVTSVVRKRLGRSEDIPVAAIYRASLAQLQAKMRHVRQMYPLNHLTGFECDPHWKSALSFTMTNMIRQERHYNLSPVALIIDSVGNVEINGKSFSPVFSGESNALNIRLDNLREYCKRMSEPETHSAERIEGYELNSIPNAKWERHDPNDEKSIVLKNPDEIIPPDYDCNNMQTVLNDLEATRRFCLYKLRFGMEEFRAMVNYDNNGDPGMLVSTSVVPGQCLKVNKEVISGSQSQFWSSEPITQESWRIGVLGLVGEVLNPMEGSFRSNIGALRTVVDWHQVSGMTVV